MEIKLIKFVCYTCDLYFLKRLNINGERVKFDAD